MHLDYIMAVFGSLLSELMFRPKFCPATERRLQLAQARAQEAILCTHVDSALTFVDTLAGELPFDQAIRTYLRIMGVHEPLASAVASRALVSLGTDLTSPRRRARDRRVFLDVTDDAAVSSAPALAEPATVPGLLRQHESLNA
jgi:hypothetical protein